MDKYALRHLMAAIIVSEELKVPSIRSGDAFLGHDRLKKQFTVLLENTYYITDLMLELGDQREEKPEEGPLYP